MIPLRELLEAGLVLAGSAVAAAVVRSVLSRLSVRFDKDEKALLDDLFRALRLPAVLIVLLGGAYLALFQINSWQKELAKYSKFFEAGATLIIVIAATQAASLVIAWYSRRTDDANGSHAHIGLLKKISILAIWVLGTVQILTQLGQSVGPLLASLGIASLAVGLALQDTIANLFGGFYIVADRSVRPGDYVKLDNGQEGFVEAVGWRNTRIRLWANNVVLVPNAKLVQSVITNMNLPNASLTVYTYCGVSYDSDLEEVERITLEVANEVIRAHPGADLTFNPVVRYKEFGESNINFVVAFRAIEVGAQYLLQHEFIKALHKRFKAEKIEISYPVRKLVWDAVIGDPSHIVPDSLERVITR